LSSFKGFPVKRRLIDSGLTAGDRPADASVRDQSFNGNRTARGSR
jgi:hypothetical protein